MESENISSVNSTQANLAQKHLAQKHLAQSMSVDSPSDNMAEPANTIRMQSTGAEGTRASASASGSSSPSGMGWRPWLTENGPQMLLFARNQTRTMEDAEDILQDALVKLARKVDEGSFDGGQESWKPFLYTAIRRLAIDLGRKNDRRSKREEKSEADRRLETGGVSDPWFESGASNEESRNLLEVELRKLPKKFSEVIIMKIWGEQTFAEIGKALDVPLNTVASRYRYGLERLRKSLESSRARDDV